MISLEKKKKKIAMHAREESTERLIRLRGCASGRWMLGLGWRLGGTWNLESGAARISFLWKTESGACRV